MYIRLYGFITEEKLHTLITTQNTQVDLTTTDQELYEALGSVKKRNEIDINLLVKLLEVTTVESFEHQNNKKRKILTHEKVEEIRK